MVEIERAFFEIQVLCSYLANAQSKCLETEWIHGPFQNLCRSIGKIASFVHLHKLNECPKTRRDAPLFKHMKRYIDCVLLS